MVSHLPVNVTKLCKLLTEEGFVAYIAGGAVRDMLLKKEPQDYDIATDAKPAEILRVLKEAGIKAVGTHAKFGTVIAIPAPKETYEITTFRTEGPYSDGRRPDSVAFTDMDQDAKRRDFTVNGLFFDPFDQKIIDVVGGKVDVSHRVLRFIGNPEERIQEDHLRILRFVRFLHTLGFKADPESERSVKEFASLIISVSGERIRDEMNKAFSVKNPAGFIRLLDAYGLLSILLPEVKALQGVVQGKKYHSEGDAFAHTLLALKQLPPDTSKELIWATLMHDLGKKQTQRVHGEAVSFYKHEKYSTKLAEGIMKQFHFPKAFIKAVSFAISKHMMLHKLEEMREGKRVQLVKNEHFPLLFSVFQADMAASVPGDPTRREEDKKKVDSVREIYEREKENKYPPLISGRDLIKLGLQPGPQFSRILDHISSLQLEKRISTKIEAIAIVKSLFLSKKKKK